MKRKRIITVPVKKTKSDPCTVDINAATELVFILDRSGSMGGLEDDTIGGFNSMIEKQKAVPGECYVTTVLFDHEILTLHDRVPLNEIQPLTREDYTVRGCTALVDAIGITLNRIDFIHRHLRAGDVPANVMFVITTDGMENASKEYSSAKVKKMIESHKEKGWEFLFIGANIDAVETAGRFGIAKDKAVNYHADSKGTSVVFGAVSRAVGAMRADSCLEPSWCETIAEDYRSRK